MNSFKISKYTISDWYFIGVLFVLAICMYYGMADLDNMTEVGTGKSYLLTVFLTVIQIPFLIYVIRERINSSDNYPPFIRYYIIYFFWMTAITLLTDETHNIFGLTVLSMSLFVFPLLLVTSYFRARHSEIDKWFFVAIIFIMLCLAVQYKNLYTIANQVGTENKHIAVSYFPLFVLPILFLSHSKIVRYVSAIVTAVIIISSIKRGGVIALGSSLFVYVIVKQYVSGRSKIKQLLILSAFTLIIGGVVYHLSQAEENNVVERIINIQDDGGSGRDVVWEDTYNNIQNRDLVSRLVGDGYRSAQTVSKYHLPAHNDGLEIWYDFGGIGLVLYCIAFLSLSAYAIRLMKRKSQYAPHLCMIMTYYFIFSMASIVVLYPWLALVMLSVGIVVGLAEREKEESKSQLHKNTNNTQYV